jgi:CYTH domain-containing protein
MELELERTFLLKNIPDGLEKCKSVEIIDIYVPKSSVHPVLRIRKRGDKLEITKKQPITDADSSEQSEHTISLSKEEFEELSQITGKRFRKIRYYYPFDSNIAEIDIYKDALEGLSVVDVEFDSKEKKDVFTMPEFCLVDVTQDKIIAGGMLAGKKYSDIEAYLEKYNYKKITTTF